MYVSVVSMYSPRREVGRTESLCVSFSATKKKKKSWLSVPHTEDAPDRKLELSYLLRGEEQKVAREQAELSTNYSPS